jgi:hypothetical protein
MTYYSDSQGLSIYHYLNLKTKQINEQIPICVFCSWIHSKFSKWPPSFSVRIMALFVNRTCSSHQVLQLLFTWVSAYRMWQSTEYRVSTHTGTTQLWCAPTNKHLSGWCRDLGGLCIGIPGPICRAGTRWQKYSTSALQLQSGEAVRRVAPTQAAAFPKLQLVIGSAVRCTKIVDMFYL